MKKSSTIFIWAFAMLMLGSGIVSAQLPEITSQQRPDIRAEAIKIENHYEVLLRNAFRNYYYPQSFIVDVNASLEEVMIPRDYERPREVERPIVLDQLPGLPVLPENLTRKEPAGEDEPLVPGSYDKAFQISQLDILIVVDNSYSQDDREFVQTLARSVAKIDEFRGDNIRVEARNFPRDKRGLTQEEQQQRAEVQAEEAEADDEPVVAMPPPEIDDQPEEAEIESFFDYRNPLFFWSALALLLLLILILVWWVARRNRKSIQEEVQNETLMNPLLLELREELDKFKEKAEKRTKEENNQPTEEERAQYQADCSYLINQYISHPGKVAGLLKQWMNGEDDGNHKAARAIKSANPKLLSTLRPSLERKAYQSLESAMEELPPLSLRERIDEARSFRKTLRGLEEDEDNKSVTDDMFNFLNQMSDSQIQLLVKEESDDMVAILMAQLDGDRASKVMQRFDKTKRGPILIKMGNIDNLPISAYKEIASHFSRKALEITNMKYVAADGVQSILKVIDELPVDQQEEYISTISETDLELANRVKQYFVAFNDIPSVSDSVMEEALAEVETETLVYALMETDQAVYDKVMTYRPKREQMLIKSEIESRSDVTTNEMEMARKDLLMAIRNVMKKRTA